MDVQAILTQTAHRPYELPAGRWSMTQSWHDLLFAHWPIDVSALRPLVPAELELDSYDGRAWVGVVPFRMSGVRPRGMPTVRWLSDFPELNVRTYVRHGGKAGVWFFSLDAAQAIAVQVARTWFHLPYFRARMRCDAHGEDIDYASKRTHRRAPEAELRAKYGPSGDVELARSGTLEHFLTERYCLYTLDRRKRVVRGDIQHAPWPLQPAHCELEHETMIRAAGLERSDEPPHILFARRLDVVIWSLRQAWHGA